MAVKTNVIITVNNRESKTDKDIWFYEGDNNLDFYFTIKDDRFEVIKSDTEIKYYSFTVQKPDGIPIYKNTLIPLETDGTVKFTINKQEIDKVGVYKLQIHLYDNNSETKAEFKLPPINFEAIKKLQGENVTLLAKEGLDLLTENKENISVNGNYGIKISELPITTQKTNAYTIVVSNGINYRISLEELLKQSLNPIEKDFINNLE